MALFVLRKLILQSFMRSHSVGLDVWFLVGPFVYFHTLCVRTAKARARLRGCAGSPEPLLVAYAIRTIISWAGSYHLSTMATYTCLANVQNHLSLRMTKPTTWHVRSAKTRVFALRSVGSQGPNISSGRQRRLIRLGVSPGWFESSLDTQVILMLLFFFFCCCCFLFVFLLSLLFCAQVQFCGLPGKIMTFCLDKPYVKTPFTAGWPFVQK